MNPQIRAELQLAADVLAKQMQAVATELSLQALGDEDDVTSQILARLKLALETLPSGAITWSANVITGGASIGGRRLKSRGAGSEESRTGADAVIVLDIDVPGLRTTKGLLIQAKNLVGGEAKSNAERLRLLSQCDAMLQISPASFVWAYGRGIGVFSANAVAAADGRFSDIVHTWPFDVFFLDFLICWIGDSRIDSIAPARIDEIAAYDASHALLVTANSRQEEFVRVG